MSESLQRISAGVGFYGAWFLLAVFGVILAFQLHTTAVFIGLAAVTSETFRPAGWTTATIYGLSRFLYLVVGGLWLGYVAALDSYLRTGAEQGYLFARVARALIVLGVLYGLCYLVLFLLT